ncbi:oxygenase MpaB family protein [Nocardia sp. NPDC005366]|uniref:oxygenase MpaB family protein n=1 Tax=Nocardia sp. NPDC005366 TaxID=3156878 RepID=UPI0033BA76E4
MTAPLRATTPEPALTCRYGTADDFDMEEFWTGITAFLGGTANVIMQLSLQPVAYGVMESPVESGRITVHPYKRLRTTLTYLAVALMGTDEDKRIYKEAVNISHRQIRSGPDSPVKYNAFDPTLQLWVAACLYWGIVDLEERLHGPLDPDTAEVFYQYASRLGTTLQMRREMWPADRAAFEEYWNSELATKTIDPRTRAFFNDMINLKMIAKPLRVFAPFQRFLVVGLLPPQLREQMRMTWTDRDERVMNALMHAIGATQRRFPKPVKLFPLNACLWDMRRRHRLGKPLV